MRLCAIAFKPCWQDENGRWLSDGGHPYQMAAIGSLFDEMTLVVNRRRKPGTGGMALPAHAEIVALRSPNGADFRRKISVVSGLPYYVRSLVRHIRRADVVHTAVPSDIGLLGIVIALVLRKKLIVRYSGSWAVTGQTTLANRFTRMLMRTFAGGRNVMLATGEGEAPPAPGVSWLFSTALSESEMRNESPDFDRSLQSPPRLAYVGRLSGEKGVANLIDAFGLLDAEGFQPLPEITLIGDGPERGSLEKRARALPRGGMIRFAGQLDRAALKSALARADFCVQPSLTEGFSKAWLDAFVEGLPVLASHVGAAGPVIGGKNERGWLVPPGDVGALAAALRAVIRGPVEWPALRRRCRAYAEGRTLEAWARAIGERCADQWKMGFADGKVR